MKTSTWSKYLIKFNQSSRGGKNQVRHWLCDIKCIDIYIEFYSRQSMAKINAANGARWGGLASAIYIYIYEYISNIIDSIELIDCCKWQQMWSTCIRSHIEQSRLVANTHTHSRASDRKITQIQTRHWPIQWSECQWILYLSCSFFKIILDLPALSSVQLLAWYLSFQRLRNTH